MVGQPDVGSLSYPVAGTKIDEPREQETDCFHGPRKRRREDVSKKDVDYECYRDDAYEEGSNPPFEIAFEKPRYAGYLLHRRYPL